MCVCSRQGVAWCEKRGILSAEYPPQKGSGRVHCELLVVAQFMGTEIRLSPWPPPDLRDRAPITRAWAHVGVYAHVFDM